MFDSRSLGLALLALIGITGPTRAAGDVGRGRVYAEAACAGCHAIRGDEATSPGSKAIEFMAVANMQGLSSPMLMILLGSAHQAGPKIATGQNDLQDVAAYILSLK